MKKIRIDYYHYKLRRGRAYILLNKNDANEYFIPFRYVQAEEKIDANRWDCSEDDGDLVFIDYKLNESRLHGKNYEWIPLVDIEQFSLSTSDSRRMVQYAYLFFISLCPEYEPVQNKIEEKLDAFLVNEAKRSYISELQEVLDGKPIRMMDAVVTPPNPELVKDEINTLAHFCLHREKPNDFIHRRNLLYGYGQIDWRLLGSRIEFMPLMSEFDKTSR